MTKVKMCGIKREEDIFAVNEIRPDYIGFIFFAKSKRYVSPKQADILKKLLDKNIKTVGVFVDEDINTVAKLLNCGTIDVAQLHGNEDDEYIIRLKAETNKPIIKAFRILSEQDAEYAQKSIADMILLDAGAGDGKVFDWSLVQKVKRPYFLAGGLNPENVRDALQKIHPYALDVSSGIETGGLKDAEKMKIFMDIVRKEEKE